MPKITKATTLADNNRIDSLYSQICTYLQDARNNVARSINTEIIKTYWLIGKAIIEEEQHGKRKAKYGAFLIKELSTRLTNTLKAGFSMSTLKDI